MARPKTVSDEDVLSAALEVLADRGVEFTLTDLARRVGLSRATLIQRFGDRDAILLKMAQHEVALTRSWLASLPVAIGRDALWRFLQAIVGGMDAGGGFSARVAVAALEVRDPQLRMLAAERYALVQAAIEDRLPEGGQRGETARHIHAVIAGATMQWVVDDGSVGLTEYVLDRLRWDLDHRSGSD